MSATQFRLKSEAEIIQMADDFKIIAGVYFLIDEGRIVYVGQSNNVYARVRRHYHLKGKKFTKFAIIEAALDDLDALETAYIKRFAPEHNRTLTGTLRTPETSNEGNLNRGYSDRVSFRRQLKAMDNDPDWITKVCAKLDAR